jgi:SAM-dependent methyltransferase
VAWSHGSRFAVARALVSPFAGGRLLDYGCGDGTFVAMVHDRFAQVIGTDVDAAQLASCADRFGRLSSVAFLPQSLVDADAHQAGANDVVTCMEVLEHCVEAERARVIERLRRLVADDGRVIVSVPIETGLSLPAKQVARRLAGWRGIGDYRHTERYSWREMARMTFAGPATAIARPVYDRPGGPGGPYQYHGHKGFNWRTLARELGRTFAIERYRYSPMPWLRAHLNSQVWLICRPR